MSATYIFANWKMYLDFDESCILASRLREEVGETEAIIALFPSDIALKEVARIVEGSSLHVGAQNAIGVPPGAYTGAVSPSMVKDVGAEYVILGHSERRHIFGEDDTSIRKNIDACLEADITPVICIGETKEEKEGGKREYRLKKQLMKAFENLPLSRDNQVIVAYEPVWAIGTGDACLPADADDIHGWIAQEIRTYTAHAVPLLYGGSVTALNVVSYISLPTVQGVLVGSAGTGYESFMKLVNTLKKTS
jgi:triosephosphate isomerase